jgi:hypothetical protein
VRGDAVGGQLVVDPPAAEVQPGLVRLAVEHPARLVQVPDRQLEVLPGELERVVGVRVLRERDLEAARQ